MANGRLALFVLGLATGYGIQNGGQNPTPPPSGGSMLLEDGASFLMLEDDASKLLLEA